MSVVSMDVAFDILLTEQLFFGNKRSEAYISNKLMNNISRYEI